jgi:hypothetical protein
MKGRTIGFFSATIAGLACMGSSGVAEAQEVPDNVSIRSIRYSGPGCPQGSADVALFNNNTAFVITYNEFLAEASPGLPLSAGNKFCTVILDIQHPPGWSYTVGSIVYRGNAVLADDVTARFAANYSFPGTLQARGQVFLSGPLNNDFILPQNFSLEIWQPRCSGGALPLTVRGTAAIDTTRAPTGSGIIRVEQQDGTFDMICNLRWRRC